MDILAELDYIPVEPGGEPARTSEWSCNESCSVPVILGCAVSLLCLLISEVVMSLAPQAFRDADQWASGQEFSEVGSLLCIGG